MRCWVAAGITHTPLARIVAIGMPIELKSTRGRIAVATSRTSGVVRRQSMIVRTARAGVSNRLGVLSEPRCQTLPGMSAPTATRTAATRIRAITCLGKRVPRTHWWVDRLLIWHRRRSICLHSLASMFGVTPIEHSGCRCHRLGSAVPICNRGRSEPLSRHGSGARQPRGLIRSSCDVASRPSRRALPEPPVWPPTQFRAAPKTYPPMRPIHLPVISSPPSLRNASELIQNSVASDPDRWQPGRGYCGRGHLFDVVANCIEVGRRGRGVAA